MPKQNKSLCCLCIALLLLLTPTSLSSCSTAPAAEAVYWQMDCAFSVRAYGETDAAQAALQAAEQSLKQADALLSTTQTDSEVARFNAGTAGEYGFSAEVQALLQQALQIGRTTDGAFSITVEPLSALWKQAAGENRLPRQEELSAMLALTDALRITQTEQGLAKDADGVQITLGGIGKGYAAEQMLTAMKNAGATGGIVSCTSTVAVFGEKPDGSPFCIALRDPRDPAKTMDFTIRLEEGQYLSVSGGYERYYEIGGARYSHILDPKTGNPPENGLLAVAVVAPDGALADALSTACSVLGEEASRALQETGTWPFEVLFIYENAVSHTDGFPLQKAE